MRTERKQQTKRGTETENATKHNSCGKQAASAQESKHTAGLPWEEANGGGACLPQPPSSTTMAASLPADSCTSVIYFSPPHLAGKLLPITESRGSLLTARHPARALASWCDTLCCWTLPRGAPLISQLLLLGWIRVFITKSELYVVKLFTKKSITPSFSS